MEIINNIQEIGLNLKNINLSDLQNKFLNSKIGQIANFALDTGLKYILPDFIEDDVIEIKDEFIKNGFSEAVNTAVEKATEIGKTAVGIVTGNFDSISQAQEAIKKGGLIDEISNIVDYTVKELKNKKIISSNVAKIIKDGKKVILNDVKKDIDNEFSTEIKSLEKLEKYINAWNECYSNKDMDGLNKNYKKIKNEEKKILPLENIVKNINKIENINELIKNSTDFDFSEMYLKLSEKMQ